MQKNIAIEANNAGLHILYYRQVYSPSFISFACPKETNQRKRHRVHVTAHASVVSPMVLYYYCAAELKCMGTGNAYSKKRQCHNEANFVN